MYIITYIYIYIYNHIYIDNQRCIQPNIACPRIFEAPSTYTFRFCKERLLRLGASRGRQAERKVDTADACLACPQKILNTLTSKRTLCTENSLMSVG